MSRVGAEEGAGFSWSLVVEGGVGGVLVFPRPPEVSEPTATTATMRRALRATPAPVRVCRSMGGRLQRVDGGGAIGDSFSLSSEPFQQRQLRSMLNVQPTAVLC